MVVNVSRTALSSRRYPSGLEKSEQPCSCSANIVVVPVVGRPRDALLPTCSFEPRDPQIVLPPLYRRLVALSRNVPSFR
jgi:hypothetical protein